MLELIDMYTKQQKRDVIFTSVNFRLYISESPDFLGTSRRQIGMRKWIDKVHNYLWMRMQVCGKIYES